MAPCGGRKNRVEGGGRLTGHAVGGGRQRQCRFVERGGRGGCAASGGPAAGPTRGEGKRAGPKRNSENLLIQIIFKQVQIVLIQRWTTKL
jgi:hypothetical protein